MIFTSQYIIRHNLLDDKAALNLLILHLLVKISFKNLIQTFMKQDWGKLNTLIFKKYVPIHEI